MTLSNESSTYTLLDLSRVAQYVIEKHNQHFRKVEVNGFNLPYWTHEFDVLKTLYRVGAADEISSRVALGHDIPEECKDEPQDRLWAEIRSIFGHQATISIVDLTFIPRAGEIAPWKQKQKYLIDMKDKSLDAIAVKPCDRHENIMDFIKQGNVDYARKYADKGDIIFENADYRRSDIDNRWGKGVTDNILRLRTDYKKVLAEY